MIIKFSKKQVWIIWNNLLKGIDTEIAKDFTLQKIHPSYQKMM